MELTKEELYFQHWIYELIDLGLIKFYEHHPIPFEITNPVVIEVKKALKTKIKTIERTLMNKWTYTPDFYIRFNESFMLRKLWQPIDDIRLPMPLIVTKENKAFIEIKPSGRLPYMAMSDNKFILNQKAVFKNYGTYVNRIVPMKLFEQTFVPKKVLEDPDMIYKVITKHGIIGESKIKFRVRTISMYLNDRVKS